MRHYLKEWRRYRGLTQEVLAAQMNMTASSISQIEKGKQGFTDSTLQAAAAALDCEPGMLLLVDPYDGQSLWALWNRIPEKERAVALKMLAALAPPLIDL